MLLEHHGIPHRVFLRLQEQAVDTYLEMLLNEQIAAKELDACAPMGRPLNHKDLHQAGLSLTTDPYFRKVLKLILHNSLRKVKCEARIHLPTDMGRNLMGCMDEYGVLEYDQVHVKISPMKTDVFTDVKMITGPVIVTKFPAVHPGDMRRFEAVEKPELAHLVDCIVFPQKGRRPHPSEMAGSDLDGDEYFVTWMKEFLDNFSKENAEPLDYSPVKKIKLGRDIVATDMYQFISDYIKNDQLGKIANAHKAIADREGLDHKLAVKLAEKFSVAVDFAKTGECPSLELEEQITDYPDFMQKHDVATVYESRRVLGVMYRKVSLLDDLLEQSVDEKKDEGVNWSQIKYKEIDKKVMREAKSVYREYCNAVRELMQLYGVQTEEELISGNVTQFHRRFMEKEDMFATSKIVKKRVSVLRADFRKKFFTEFKINPNDISTFPITKSMMMKAEAWHKVAYFEPVLKSKGETNVVRVMSFPWLVADVLAKVIGMSVSSISLTSPCVDKITKSLITTYYRRNSLYFDTMIESDSEVYRQLVDKYPAIQPLLFILSSWCATIRMKPMFPTVIEQLLKFLDLPNIVITAELIDAISGFGDHLRRCDDDIIQLNKIGQIIVAFMKKIGSQNFLSAKRNPSDLKPIKQMVDRTKLSTHAKRAHFSLSVDNTCHQLVHLEETQKSSRRDKLCKEKTVVIPKNLLDDILVAEKQIRMCFDKLADTMDLDLREVLLNKRRRRKRRVGTLCFRGGHKAVHLLSRVANLWLKNFEKEEDGDYYMVFYKLFHAICY